MSTNVFFLFFGLIIFVRPSHGVSRKTWRVSAATTTPLFAGKMIMSVPKADCPRKTTAINARTMSCLICI
jgi:hypothetical protein